MSSARDDLENLQNDTAFDHLFDFTNASMNDLTARKDSARPETVQNDEAKDAAAYANFDNWIPGFVKPARPCEYCSSKRLECYMSFGSVTCNSCLNLFRTCSFSPSGDHVHNHTDSSRSGFLDTLHVVSETSCTEQGALTGLKSLKSKSYDVGRGSDRGRSSSRSSEVPSPDEDKKTPRFSKPQVKILRDWFAVHADFPYPTEDEKVELERRTGLKQAQIATWLANTRRRTKTIKPKRAPSPAVRHASENIDMSAPANARPWSDVSTLRLCIDFH